MLCLAISVCLFLSNVRIIYTKLLAEIQIFRKGNPFGDTVQTTEKHHCPTISTELNTMESLISPGSYQPSAL